MKDPLQFRLSGAGGQGLLTAGILLGQAAVLEGRHVVQTQSYGPEARLGASRSEVVISAHPIAYPKVTQPDAFLALSSDAIRRYLPDTGPDTVVLMDEDALAGVDHLPPTEAHLRAAPLSATALDLGNKLVTNVVALGVLNALVPVVDTVHLRTAVLAHVPPEHRDLNARALQAGRELAAGGAVRRVPWTVTVPSA